MTGNHRVEDISRARIAVAGALTAGALLLAPVGVALAMPGVAHAAPPSGPGTGGGGTGAGGTGGAVHKQTFRFGNLLKIEIKHVQGKPDKIKIVPFPGVVLPHLPRF